MRYAIFVVAVVAALVTLGAQSLSDVRRLYDAGKFKDAIDATEGAAAAAEETTPRLRYLEALSHEKLKDADAARGAYQQLADGAQPAWAAIGHSALAVMDKKLDDALESANQAVAFDEPPPEAYYQRGIVLMHRREYDDAAGAFDRATTLDPVFASAHYWGGLAESRAKHVSRMANHFEAFLKLAPNAPERPEVESIMRTIRGR